MFYVDMANPPTLSPHPPAPSPHPKSTLEIPLGVIPVQRLLGMGLSRHNVQDMVRREELEHLGRGLYMNPDSPLTEKHDMAQVGARVPLGVICLTSALQFHEMTTVSPWKIHLLLPVGSRSPKIDFPPIEITLASGDAYSEGIEQQTIEGVNIKVTSIAKTIVDCFKYRNKIGLDIALEALKEGIQEQKTTRAAIYYYAKICRMENVMRPYLEALSL
jgi:predicted transcriptional regulator of viral defense system